MRKTVIVLGLALIALSPALAQEECFPAPDGMVAWWPGDGTTTDIEGGNDAVLNFGASFDTGKVQEAFSLDGLDDRVRVADPIDGSLDFGAAQSFSYDAWIATTMTGNAEIIEKQSDPFSSSAPLYQIAIGDGKIFCGISSSGGADLVQFSGTTSVNDGLFHHVACVRDVDQDALIVYVDGQEDGRATDVTTGSFASAADLVIGGSRGLPPPDERNFAGLIDEVEIFSRALSPGEVQAMYDAGAAGKCKDEDGDGFRPPEDCDETDASINPDAFELPGNFVDENCDGSLGDCDPCFTWRNHGEYIRCTSQAVNLLVGTGYITEEDGDALVTSAARSDIGKKGYVAPECQ